MWFFFSIFFFIDRLLKKTYQDEDIVFEQRVWWALKEKIIFMD